MGSFVAVLEIHLFLPENGSLKGKRKEIVSLKAQLQRRFGASVSETGHHDLWQRATLAAALVGGSAGELEEAAAKLGRFVESRFPDGTRVERRLISVEEVFD